MGEGGIKNGQKKFRRLIWTAPKKKSLKVTKSKKVSSFSSHLQENERNHYSSTFVQGFRAVFDYGKKIKIPSEI